MKKGINISKTQPPCNGCEERKAGCHSTCEEYAEFRKSREEIYDKRVEYRNKMYGIRDVTHCERRKKNALKLKGGK